MTFQPESTLAALMRYNNWANAQVLAACEKLDAGQLAAAAPEVDEWAFMWAFPEEYGVREGKVEGGAEG